MEKLYHLTIVAFDNNFCEYLCIDDETGSEVGMDPFVTNALKITSPKLSGHVTVKGVFKNLKGRPCILVSKIVSDKSAAA